MAIILFIFVILLSKSGADEVCGLRNYDYGYQKQVKWTGKDIWSMLASLEKSFYSCKIPSKIPSEIKEQFKLVSLLKKCSKNNGKIVTYKERIMKRIDTAESEKIESNCYEMSKRIDLIEGTIENSHFEGKIRVRYGDDSSEIIGTAHQSLLHGKMLLRDTLGFTQAIGHYENGLAHGPFWILPSFGQNQYMYVHFNRGYLVPENAIFLDSRAKYAMMGTLNGTFLEEAELVDLEKVAEYQCIPVIKMPLRDPQITPQRILSPFSVSNDDKSVQRMMIRPAKILFYNRVAKTGSQSIMALLRALAKKNDFVVESVPKKREVLIDSNEGLQLQMSNLLHKCRPMVFIQHYSFIDFSKFGYNWTPDWFNIVRDPVEKVISYFYYRRAGWVIAERLKYFPDDKLESVDFFKKDFESCVLKDDPECRFVQNERNNQFGDHRGQMMQFCGHAPVCQLFNNPEALEIAKKNVEKYYTVVGITENMDMTLTVAEKKMPQYFKGARKVYFNDPEVIEARSSNFFKFPVSEEVKAIVRKRFKYEIEFYNFCKQRLLSQLSNEI